MQRIIDGVLHFKEKEFEKYRELFEVTSTEQNPHTLFIGCSDSRVVPNLVTSTLPGELFVIRNIANIVPPYRIAEEYMATTSAIEYAVQHLKVENIIICGHSNCGGCSALYQDEAFYQNVPDTKKWIELAMAAKEQAQKIYPHDTPERHIYTEQLNVLEQMKHLFTYPFIREKVQKKELNIYGWYYILKTGDIYQYDLTNEDFELIGHP